MKTPFILDCPQTGFCTINIPLLVKKWGIGFFITEYDSKDYRLCAQNKKSLAFKVTISKETAFEIIQALKLKRCQSSTFALAASYKSIKSISFDISKIRSRIEIVKDEVMKKSQELSWLSNEFEYQMKYLKS